MATGPFFYQLTTICDYGIRACVRPYKGLDMLKWIIWLLLILALIMVRVDNVRAQAAATYTHEFNSTNLYTNDGQLTYHFTNLDANANYVWLLQGIDENGIGIQALGMKFFTGGTSATIQWIDDDFDRGNGTLYSGPARVIDNFGNRFGPHYLLPGCLIAAVTNCGPDNIDWVQDGTAENPEDDRFVIGRVAHIEDENVEGWFHPLRDHNVVMIVEGDFTFLHYRADVPSTDEYAIMRMSDSTVLARFIIADLITYNTHVGLTVLTARQPENNFIVLNTSGEQLGFINRVQEDAAFNQIGSGDNPFTLTLGLGAYDYIRTDNVGAHVTDGESVLLIGSGGRNEWRLFSNQDEVRVATNINLDLHTQTVEIFDDGFRNHTLIDDIGGAIDTADYDFTKRRSDFYEVQAQPVAVALDWLIAPVVSNLEDIGGLTNRRFIVSHDYVTFVPNAQESQDLRQRIENNISGIGFDTTFGRGLALVLMIMVAFIALGRRHVRGIIPYGLTFIIIGGVWIGVGMSDPLTTILFGVSSLVMVFLMINARSNRSSI